MENINYKLKGFAVIVLALSLSSCVNITPSDQKTSMLKTDIAIEHFKNGNIDGSMIALSDALEKNRYNAMAWMMLGTTYLADGNPENVAKAEMAFKRAVFIDSNNPQIRNNYGQFLISQKRLREAKREFSLAANTIGYDSRANAFSNLGYASLAMYQQGDKAELNEAKDAFNKALQIAPGFTSALNGLKQLN